MQTESAHAIYEFGPFRLEEAEFLLLRGGRPVPLKGKTFQLLLTLVRNAGHALTKEELMAQLWPQSFVEEHNLTVHVSDLRKALGREHSYVETVARRGYRFVSDVNRIVEGGAGGHLPKNGSARVGDDKGGTPAKLAVLPFKSIAGEAADEYLGLGLADALITRLSALRQVIVRPTSAVRRYVDGTDPLVAGGELGVGMVLEGSIQKVGANIRVTVQLVSVADGTTLWAGKYDESCSDILLLEDSVSEQVAVSLAVELTLEESRRLLRRQTDSVEAHLAHMKGNFFWGKHTLADIGKSAEYFSKAVDHDPDYANAYVGLARAKISMFAFNSLTLTDEFPKIEETIDRALRLDHSLPEAHSIKAQLRLYIDLDWAGAAKEHRMAVGVGQHCALAYENYSIYLGLLGRFEEALALNHTAQTLEPTSLVLSVSRCRILFFAREYVRSVFELKNALELNAASPAAQFLLGLNYDQLGEYEKAQAAYRQYIRQSRDNPEVLSSLCRSLALSGDYSKARRILNQVLALSRLRHVSSYYIANAYLGLGDVEQCLSWLERAFSESDCELLLLKVDPRLEKVRTESRFLSLQELVMGSYSVRTG